MPESKFCYYGISEQEGAYKHRLVDAFALKKQRRWRGAIYLAGYSVECLLKWKLMKIFKCRHLDELQSKLRDRKVLKSDEGVYTHDLQKLLRLSDENSRLSQNLDCWKAFSLVNRWTPEWRYTADESNESDADYFFKAVEKVSDWINNNI